MAVQEESLTQQKSRQVALIKDIRARDVKARRQASFAEGKRSLETDAKVVDVIECEVTTEETPSPLLPFTGSSNQTTTSEDMDIVSDSAATTASHGEVTVELLPSVVPVFETSSSTAVLSTDLSREADLLQLEIDNGKFDIPLELQEEKNKRIKEAFGDWTRQNFKSFVDALEKFGRCRERVVKDVAVVAVKSEEEVWRFYDTFFLRSKEVTDGQRILEKADRGDKRAQREREIRRTLDWKVSRHPDPLNYFPISYGGTKGRQFSEEDDVFIILKLHEHGYGCWEQLRKDIRNSPQFR